jgi:hypothetical protein
VVNSSVQKHGLGLETAQSDVVSDHDKLRDRRLGATLPHETLWDPLLEPALLVGEQLPYDIAYWLDHRDG